ncbi:MAG: NAD-dependent epimerase/dehydratase family protein [Planctomycetota bacterium]|nr:MAG: NAD-dependent epimerase/dehydratase family protein [Planctomycetota bacterium]
MAKIAVITGSAGLIGSESVYFLGDKMDLVVGIDNDMRRYFFGDSASTLWCRRELEEQVANYRHYSVDIRDKDSIERIFREYGEDIDLIIHTAAQPSHDWAAREPFTDFHINATGTLILLEATRQFCSKAKFIFTSTNKVYGDRPNTLPLRELEKRYELEETHPFYRGIDESMSIDQSLHSLFGASKVAADILVQEYARYFGMFTVCFRGGCLTGGRHSGAELHGFLSYLMRCAITKSHYTIYGYKGKQVRDNIHSYDLVNAFWHYYQNPRPGGEVYNIGGGRHSHCSVLEAMDLCQEISGNKINYTISPTNRIGDHIWWISDVNKFRSHYPEWEYKYDLKEILSEIYRLWMKKI